jgi:hypothetical protein
MFDINNIIRQPVLLATFAIAVPAWLIAFIAQAISEARYGYGMFLRLKLSHNDYCSRE